MNKIAPLFLIILIGSMWQFPSAGPALSIVFLLFTLSMAVSSIFKKHKTSDNPRSKIAKDVLILVVTLLLIIFLGGLAGLIANYYARPRFGIAVGFISAIVVSFLVGYLVNKGAGKIFKG
jgi:F0F1-type ATP synthase assembly protein I